MREHAGRALEHRNLRTRARRDVTELRRDIPAADHRDPVRQLVQLQELLMRDEVLGSGEPERCRPRSGCDQDVLGFQSISTVNFDRVGCREPCRGVKGVDPLFPITLFLSGRNWTGEGSLKGDEFAPGDPRVLSNDAAPRHSPDVVHDLGTSDQHLLGIAAAKRAGAAEGTVINYGDLPSCRGNPVTGDHRRGPRPDDNQIVCSCHRLSVIPDQFL